MGRTKLVYDKVSFKSDVQGGASYKALREKYGVCNSTIKVWVQECGLDAPLKGYRTAVISERDKEMKNLRSQGFSLQEIGDKMGVTRESVRLSLKKQGVSGGVGETNRLRSRRQEREAHIEAYKSIHFEKMIEMVKEGLSLVRIAEIYEVKTTFLKRLGLHKVKQVVNLEKENEIKRLYVEEGYSMERVGKALGLHTLTVLRKLREMGVESRPAKRWNKV